ncbi:CAP domain-containing protein [Bacillus timonensis]|nr:CAP domain-containing protein [Bacillus timonensis]
MIRKLSLNVLLVGVLALTACNMDNEATDDETKSGTYGVISSDKTSTPSNQYPHTKAILVQPAKYKYYKVEIGQKGFTQVPGNIQATPGQLEQKQFTQVPIQPQQKAPAPTQQQPKTTTPAPAKPEQQQPQAQEPAKAPTQKATGLSEFEAKVVELTNVERRKQGLPDLQADTPLSNVAREKSNDMQAKGYFSHTSPTYGSPFDMMRDFGISYNTAGENIAKGQQSAEQVVQSWMNSEGHRKNILSRDFTHIGVGYNSSGHIWTQMFIGK